MSNYAATRIGISPFSVNQHIGVYRSFLVGAFIARYLNGKMYLRIDDTNPRHQADINSLIDDLTQIVEPDCFAPISDLEDGQVYVGANSIPAVLESQRLNVYHKYLRALQDQGFVFEKDEAIFFDIKKYLGLYGDRIGLPYQGKPRRTGSIEKSLPELCFPIAVDGGKRFLWHFTSVIDDRELGVTHIVRAKDKIDNQVPQTILGRALGFPLPQFLYTKIMLNDQPIPTVNGLAMMGISSQAIKSYLYGTITGKPEKIYTSFEDALADFRPSSVTPGQFQFDLDKLSFIQRHLFSQPFH